MWPELIPQCGNCPVAATSLKPPSGAACTSMPRPPSAAIMRSMSNPARADNAETGSQSSTSSPRRDKSYERRGRLAVTRRRTVAALASVCS